MSSHGSKSRHKPPSAANLHHSAEEAFAFALALFRGGKFDQAERACTIILEHWSTYIAALHLRGLTRHKLRQFDGAVADCQQVLEQQPESAAAWNDLGNALSALQRHAQALDAFERALVIRPEFPEALNGCGAALSVQERHEEALARYDSALALKPDYVAALNNRAGVLARIGRREKALAGYDRAIALAPGSADLHYNRGSVLAALGRHHEALAGYDRALALRPGFAEAHNNRAGVLATLKRHQEAVASCTRALQIKPTLTEALKNRGGALSFLGRHEQAIDDLERALELDSDLPFARGTLFHSKMHCCDWRNYDANAARIVAGVRANERVVEPFAFLGVSDCPADQLRCSRIWVRDQCPSSALPVPTGSWPAHRRIRVAYVASDLREHAVGYLIAGLLERHDRGRFEIVGVSLGVDDGSAMRSRLEKAFDRFVDVRAKSDQQVAQLLRDMEIDIAVDCNGFTTGARPAIFAMRPTPVQASYIGFPGTMGADYIDYLIADEVVIPRDLQGEYAENIVYLPDTYQANDSTRRIAERSPSRSDAGLPERAFVFCCFNNSYKIAPAIFDIWMRILHRVEGSVLWLIEGNASACRNLRREAAERSVSPDRIVFAPKIPSPDHLARHQLADLFLDTLPYNAHTTASDALWAGLPVLTCLGTTFAGRVAASLLQAIGLRELIADSLAEYESLALHLAGDCVRLARLRQQLSNQRDTWPLFDTPRFCRHMEAAYTQMWERHQRSERPAGFSVHPSSA